MVQSEKQFNKRAKQLIRMIFDSEDIYSLPYDDLAVIAECIQLGYLNSKYLQKTEDGKYHFELFENSAITVKGIKFLLPKRNWNTIIMTCIASISLVINVIQAIC